MTVPIESLDPPACGLCNFWVEGAAPNPLLTGECRRLPPVGPGNAGVPTDHDHWCGEWTANTGKDEWTSRGPLA